MAMPRMSGFELLKRIRQRNDSLPVAIMSGYSEDLERKKVDSERDVRFLSKPFTSRQLQAALRAVGAVA
jgi:CheY-like chemotaxis protein